MLFGACLEGTFSCQHSKNTCVFQHCEPAPAWYYFKDWNPGKECVYKQDTPETISSSEIISSCVVLSNQAADETCYIS